MRPRKKNADGKTAEEWLRQYLAPHEQRAIDVIEAAQAQDFHINTIKAAKSRIGARSTKKNNEWYWYMTIGAPKPTVRAPKFDEFGYSTERPAVPATVNWMDVLRLISKLTKSGLDNQSIIKQVMDFAYPNAGMAENIVAAALRANGVDVPNKPTEQSTSTK